MSIRTSPWPTGIPSWADLGTPDMPAAKAFYSAVLGWTFRDASPEFGGYSTAEVNGSAAAGIGPLQEGAFNAWTLYFATGDIEKTESAVTENGGSILLPTGDIGDLGRMFIATDPSGAAFGVWQAGTHIGASIVNEPGGITWDDLRSTDPESARNFYNALFSFRFEEVPMAGGDYRTFHLLNEENPAGGMGGMMGMDGFPSHWVVYFGVTDADAAGEAATSSGGSVVAPAFDTPYGRMGVLADPTGATFCVVETAGAQSPDRSG